ncbi:SLC13 family permease [Desulfoscipio gibsoniae]|uniref:Sodium-dependent dicarboxylate transporter SdcS n=1 Tax=Desulfoscipio gibsoniae DSM 7213 TaxID=767817 RepID=R4KN81_9FIRM|nr:SLC13 family permease [Desulfoscipio gibsoniae]AGL03007.1 di-/tricarboxylate transporter [Desulfoscipio gibsoniae DSM 7213]
MSEGTVIVQQQAKVGSWAWWAGIPGNKPLICLLLLAFFLTMVLIPVPESMIGLMTEETPLGSKLESGTTTYVDSYNKYVKSEDALTAEQVGQRAKITVGLLLSVALLWGTEAIPLGATNFLVAVILYIFMILPIDRISQAYMKDAVFFIGGVLCVAAGVSISGLDKRIGYLLLGRIGGLKSFCFIFFPLLAVLAGFFSEHALVAIMCPILLVVYMQACKKAGVKFDKKLAVLLFIGICFAANVGGSGSPAVGGRSAVMIGYFNGYDMPMNFTQWMMYGLPLVPVLALAMGAYMYFMLGRNSIAKDFNIAKAMKENVSEMGPIKGKELRMAILFAALVILWVFFSGTLGLGGTTIIIVVAMLLSRVVTWQDLQRRVAMDVVLLYAAACAMGVALDKTGGALWLARAFLDVLPDFMTDGQWIIMAVSLMTVIITNFMSDGATVGAIGPVVLPMADIGGVHLWKIGLACSFTSSFAHIMIVGTVNNAIAYTMARDPETGAHLITVTDFIKYGFGAVIISLIVTWGFCFFGYWNLLPWPGM